MASLAPSGMIAIALLLLPVVVAVAVILALIWWTSREKPARDRRLARNVRSNGSDHGFLASPAYFGAGLPGHHHGHEHTPGQSARDPDADSSSDGGHNGASSESGAGDSGSAGDSGGADAGGGDGGGGGGGD